MAPTTSNFCFYSALHCGRSKNKTFAKIEKNLTHNCQGFQSKNSPFTNNINGHCSTLCPRRSNSITFNKLSHLMLFYYYHFQLPTNCQPDQTKSFSTQQNFWLIARIFSIFFFCVELLLALPFVWGNYLLYEIFIVSVIFKNYYFCAHFDPISMEGFCDQVVFSQMTI